MNFSEIYAFIPKTIEEKQEILRSGAKHMQNRMRIYMLSMPREAEVQAQVKLAVQKRVELDVQRRSQSAFTRRTGCAESDAYSCVE